MCGTARLTRACRARLRRTAPRNCSGPPENAVRPTSCDPALWTSHANNSPLSGAISLDRHSDRRRMNVESIHARQEGRSHRASGLRPSAAFLAFAASDCRASSVDGFPGLLWPSASGRSGAEGRWKRRDDENDFLLMMESQCQSVCEFELGMGSDDPAIGAQNVWSHPGASGPFARKATASAISCGLAAVPSLCAEVVVRKFKRERPLDRFI